MAKVGTDMGRGGWKAVAEFWVILLIGVGSTFGIIFWPPLAIGLGSLVIAVALIALSVAAYNGDFGC